MRRRGSAQWATCACSYFKQEIWCVKNNEIGEPLFYLLALLSFSLVYIVESPLTGSPLTAYSLTTGLPPLRPPFLWCCPNKDKVGTPLLLWCHHNTLHPILLHYFLQCLASMGSPMRMALTVATLSTLIPMTIMIFLYWRMNTSSLFPPHSQAHVRPLLVRGFCQSWRRIVMEAARHRQLQAFLLKGHLLLDVLQRLVVQKNQVPLEGLLIFPKNQHPLLNQAPQQNMIILLIPTTQVILTRPAPQQNLAFLRLLGYFLSRSLTARPAQPKRRLLPLKITALLRAAPTPLRRIILQLVSSRSCRSVILFL